MGQPAPSALLIVLLSVIGFVLGQDKPFCDSCAAIPRTIADGITATFQTAFPDTGNIESEAEDAMVFSNSTQTSIQGQVEAGQEALQSAAQAANASGDQDLLGRRAVAYWNAPLPEFRRAPYINITEDAGVEAGAITVIGKGVSNGYTLPDSKQSINDQRFFTSKGITASTPPARLSRYAALMKNVSPGVRRYNVFWHLYESSNITASSNFSAVICPKGYIKVPANATEMARLQMSSYHCYQYTYIYDLDSYLSLDAANGIESAAVMWGSPPAYRHPGCLGNTNNGRLGCVPRADAIPAWKDFAIFLASRWQGGSGGRIAHFIVWNEVDTPSYYDMYPEVNDTLQHIENTPQAPIYIGRLVLMIRAVHEAVKANLPTQPSMIWVPLTRMWTASPWCPGPRWGRRCNIGGINVLTGLWNTIGTSIDWSVAVHAYGVPSQSNWGLTAPYQAYTFGDLGKVRDFQIAQAVAKGVANPSLAPQAMLAATEQGWTTSTDADEDVAARHICASHVIATNAGSNIVWVAHNDAQDVYQPYPGSYGLMAVDDGAALDSATPSAPLQAYRATSIKSWRVNANNYCCKNFQQGCP